MRRVPAEAVTLLGLAVILALGVNDSPSLGEIVEVAADAEIDHGTLHSAGGSGLERVDVTVGFHAARASDGAIGEQGDAFATGRLDGDSHGADGLRTDLLELFGVRPSLTVHLIEAFHRSAVVDVGEAARPHGAVLLFAARSDTPFDAVRPERGAEFVNDFVSITHWYICYWWVVRESFGMTAKCQRRLRGFAKQS